MKKFLNINKILSILYKYSLLIFLFILWQILSMLKIIPKYLLPSPNDVLNAFFLDFKLIMYHTEYTLLESFLGISIAILLALVLSILMDNYKFFYKILYPPIVITQTIPTIAIAPLLIIWLGYKMAPKIILIVMTVFFPILISLLDGYKSIDKDNLKLLKIMGATRFQTYIHVKFPASLGYFFSGLRVSISYALISAVVSEWLGGYRGLGVYMIRVKKAFALDKMFAIIFFVSFLSLFLMYLVDILNKKIIKY